MPASDTMKYIDIVAVSLSYTQCVDCILLVVLFHSFVYACDQSYSDCIHDHHVRDPGKGNELFTHSYVNNWGILYNTNKI